MGDTTRDWEQAAEALRRQCERADDGDVFDLGEGIDTLVTAVRAALADEQRRAAEAEREQGEWRAVVLDARRDVGTLNGETIGESHRRRNREARAEGVAAERAAVLAMGCEACGILLAECGRCQGIRRGDHHPEHSDALERREREAYDRGHRDACQLLANACRGRKLGKEPVGLALAVLGPQHPEETARREAAAEQRSAVRVRTEILARLEAASVSDDGLFQVVEMMDELRAAIESEGAPQGAPKGAERCGSESALGRCDLIEGHAGRHAVTIRWRSLGQVIEDEIARYQGAPQGEDAAHDEESGTGGSDDGE